MTSKDTVLKEVREAIIRDDEAKLKQLDPYFHSDLHVSSGWYIDEKVAIPIALQKALIEDLHASHQGSWGMVCMAHHCWWPYMKRDLLVRSEECQLFIAIGKNYESVIPAKQY